MFHKQNFINNIEIKFCRLSFIYSFVSAADFWIVYNMLQYIFIAVAMRNSFFSSMLMLIWKNSFEKENFLCLNETMWNDIKCLACIRCRPWKCKFSYQLFFIVGGGKREFFEEHAWMKTILRLVMEIVSIKTFCFSNAICVEILENEIRNRDW